MKIQEMLQDEKVIGGYNDLPPNFKQITEKEFAQSSFFNYEPIRREFRQVRNLVEKEMYSAIILFWYSDGSGIAIRRDFWEGKIYFYSFYICEHDYETIENRMCYIKSKCIKCGHISEVDSSD